MNFELKKILFERLIVYWHINFFIEIKEDEYVICNIKWVSWKDNIPLIHFSSQTIKYTPVMNDIEEEWLDKYKEEILKYCKEEYKEELKLEK